MSDGPIAIVGAACRFPGAADLGEFWELLASGGHAVCEVGSERWAKRYFYHPTRIEPGKSYTWSAGLISGVDLFEPAFFGISPREAMEMDPQQRLLLELVWHAIEDAGIPATKLSGSETGVYVGASSTDYADLRLGDTGSGDSYSMTGNTLSILANRVSYAFDLRGPSFVVDTACSSSLVALHQACEAIRAGRIENAVVGGVNLLLSPYPFLGFCRASMLSRRGRCFAFDERADGYVRGEGGAAILLKPLAKALSDCDPIRAVILGCGVNSDGRTIGLSLPNPVAQAALLRSVYAEAGLVPDDLAFFEMHGTGTPAGDPIEAAAVGEALGQRRSQPLAIGSVKTNIGHLEPASGMAGLLKAALALDHGLLPPTLNCESPNPRIPFEALNLTLARNLAPIDVRGRACAGINSFGFGGTNAHVVLGRAPRAEPPPAIASPLPPLLVSARSEAALRDMARRWRETLDGAPPEQAPALVRAAARRRDQHPHRLVALGDDTAATTAVLAEFIQGEHPAAIVSGTALRDPKLVFAFSGNGAQWVGMGRQPFRHSAAFRDAIEEADSALRPALGWSVAERLDNGFDADLLARADIAQPLLFAIQVGIVRSLQRLGVEASAHFGHSVGEIAAAWAAGALSLEMAGRVVAARSRHQERTRGIGRMAALAIAGEAASELIEALGSPVEVAALNASQSVTVSGPSEALRQLGAEARRRGIVFRALDLDFAFHSRAMDPVRDELLADLEGLSCEPPRATLISTVTGDPVGTAALDAHYWWRNIRHPVRFADAMALLTGTGHDLFVEIGPHPVLQAYLHDGLRVAHRQGRVLATLSRKESESDPFPVIAAACHVSGYDISGTAAFDGPNQPRGLPLYCWHKERFWFEKSVEAIEPINPLFDHPLLGFRQTGPMPSWVNHLDQDVLPWIADHAIEGVPVLPAAAIVETALGAARALRPRALALEVSDLELRRPLPFDKGRMRELRTVLLSEDGDLELRSRPRLSSEPLSVHVVGRLSTGSESRAPAMPIARIPVQREIGADELYRLAKQLGLDYGPRFRTVTRIEVVTPEEAIAHLDPAVPGEGADEYLLHPALLDGALQGLLALLAGREEMLDGATLLPWRFGRVRIFAPFQRWPRHAALHLTRLGVRSACADITLLDESGEVVAELSDCWFRRIELTRRGNPDGRVLRHDLVPAPLGETGAPEICDRIAAVLGRKGLTGETPPFRSEQRLLFEALIAAMAYPPMLACAGSERFAIDDIIATGRLAPDSAAVMSRLLRLLERFGAAISDAPGWRLSPQNELPEAAEVWRLLLAEAPELVGELALVAAAGEALPKILAEGTGAADLAGSPMAEHLLCASPPSAVGLNLVCEALADIARGWPAERPLRILEFGTGRAARRALEVLAPLGREVSYIATCPEPEQAARLAFDLLPFAGASARPWSPGGAEEALDETVFDIVLGVHASARLRLDPEALSGLRERLAPGGTLILVEPEPNPLWDLIFGSDVQGVADVALDEAASSQRSAEAWPGALEGTGFLSPQAAPIADGPWPAVIVWARAAPIAAAISVVPIPPISVILVGGGDTLAVLHSRLARAGHRVTAIGEHGELSGAPAGAPAQTGEKPHEAIIFFADAPDSAEVIGRATEQIEALARLATAAVERDTPLWVVTRGAQQGIAGTGLVGSALWGFARTLVNEMPRLEQRLIDLPAADPDHCAECLAAELMAQNGETEVVWTAQGRHVVRLRRGLPSRWASPDQPLVLSCDQAGALDALSWKTLSERRVGPGEVGLEVRAAGLNFRDLMWGMGLLPEEALIDGFAGPTFGLEGAGVVTSVGPGVESPRIGDRVAGFVPAALATHAVTAAAALVPIPPEMGFAEAATVPVAFVTAIYALGSLARLSAGEYVLIHAAAGGVGLAAIQYAKHRGAIVIATAGSDTKRAFLRLVGADHVLDSRSLGFADAIREITGGDGVDVVLNSLSGEAMELSLGVLKPFGRFLELGKRDFYMNRRVHLRPLRQNISYFAIDVDQLPVRRADLAGDVLTEMSEVLATGAVRPLAHRVFPFAEVEDAFRLMQSSGHIGKLVLAPAGNAGVRLGDSPALALHRDGTYLVTGGLDGFGFETARWLAGHGAGALALLGRRGRETPGAAARISELQRAGVDVRVYGGDVADRASLDAVLSAIRGQQPPLRGVVHAAATIGDGLAAEVEASRIAPILRAKLGGAELLDRLTRQDPVELFLLFSSATTVLGAPGQGVYVAANLGLEALARRRRAEGLPALAVAWGPIEDVGYLAERPEAREALARRLGAKPLPALRALSALAAAAASGLPVVTIAETSLDDARRFLPILASPVFTELHGEGGNRAADDSLLEKLASADEEEVSRLLSAVVAEEAASILRLPAAGMDLTRPLSDMGMDSLMAVELRLALESRLRVDFPLVSLSEGPSINSIAGRLAAAVSARSAAASMAGLAARYESAEATQVAEQIATEMPAHSAPDEVNSAAAE
ncbi:MAG: SDR family NAD(P)-dependent oxidoreductase [Alphaproteobacteria bacterium]|nr:SDR family NAD(P)-dependent oxidoreductase [Alphaproteobacteria bacterium]